MMRNGIRVTGDQKAGEKLKGVELLKHIPYNRVVWLAAVAETIHNLEEAVWLPDWSQTAGIWHPEVSAFEFRFADTVVTLLFWITIWYFTRSSGRPARYLLGGALVMIIFNVIMPHLIATIALGRYTPGLLSGFLLNIPIDLYLLRRGLREEIFTPRILLLGAVGFALITVPLLLGLFVLGRAVLQLM
jgi:hypothetical protein